MLYHFPEMKGVLTILNRADNPAVIKPSWSPIRIIASKLLLLVQVGSGAIFTKQFFDFYVMFRPRDV